MHAVELIARALPESEAPSPPAKGEGVCCVTGVSGPVVARKDLFGASFTDGALLAAPHSDNVGLAAYRALKHRWERMSSWFCDGQEFKRLDRIGVRDAVLDSLPKRPWCGYATTSYKKHGALRTPVNSGLKAVWLFETRLVDCSNRTKMFDWWQVLNAALREGIGRSIMETLDCPGLVMRKIGARYWMDFERWARPRYKDPLYAFLCYLLPSQEELKAEQSAVKGVQKVSVPEKSESRQLSLF